MRDAYTGDSHCVGNFHFAYATKIQIFHVARPQNLNYLNTDEMCKCFTGNDEANKKFKLTR